MLTHELVWTSVVKTGPSITDAAMGRIAQISKVISEGGYDKIFQQNFECLPDEKLKKTYACYLSTSHGPIMGVLYVSTAKLAFCSDSPVAYVTEDNKTASTIYKVYGTFYFPRQNAQQQCILSEFGLKMNILYHSRLVIKGITHHFITLLCIVKATL
jgi:hypothetical protein